MLIDCTDENGVFFIICLIKSQIAGNIIHKKISLQSVS